MSRRDFSLIAPRFIVGDIKINWFQVPKGTKEFFRPFRDLKFDKYLYPTINRGAINTNSYGVKMLSLTFSSLPVFLVLPFT